MKDFIYYAPTEVIFGKNALDKLGYCIKKYGTKVMLVYGKNSIIKSGLLGNIEKILKDENIPYILFGGAKPNPTLAHAEEGVKKAIEFEADLIIGVGGGSAIDTAKAIAHGAANKEYQLWDIWTKKVEIQKSLAVGAILTIPAAGSEMSDSAVLTNEELGKKAGINTVFNRTKFAIMNPEYGFSVPKYQIACGITDIMMHTLERYFIPDVQADLTDAIAEGLLRTVMKNGKRIYEDPTDYDAMSEVFWASSLSHNNLTECGRGKDFSVHKLGHVLSAKYDVTHGASLSAVWGSWANYLYQKAPKRFADYARNVFGVKNDDDLEASKEGIMKTVSFFKSIDMPTSLSDLNINICEADFKKLAQAATLNDTLKLSRIMPLGAKEVEEIYRLAK